MLLITRGWTAKNMGATYREWEGWGDQLGDRLATLLPYLPYPHCLIITNLTVI
jgi:hypothetical protein